MLTHIESRLPHCTMLALHDSCKQELVNTHEKLQDNIRSADLKLGVCAGSESGHDGKERERLHYGKARN